MSSIPLYQRIYNKLKKEILKGKYKNGKLFPPERLLSKNYNVSHLTIRKALSILVKDGLIERKSGIGTIVVYDEHVELKSKRIKNLCLILEKSDDFFSTVINNLENECRKRSIYLHLFTHHSDNLIQQKQFERASAINDNVIVLFPTNPNCDWLKFHPALCKTIIVDEHIIGLNTAQIISDDENGAYQACRYLSDIGHKTIAHVSANSKTSGLNRLRGYQKAVKEFKLTDNASLIGNGSYLVTPSINVFEAILEQNSDCRACFCANDYSALGVMKVLKKHNLFPGKNFSLIGYGNYEISDALELTSVDQQVDKICEQIMTLIDDYSMNGALASGLYIIPVELKLRQSCIPNCF